MNNNLQKKLFIIAYILILASNMFAKIKYVGFALDYMDFIGIGLLALIVLFNTKKNDLKYMILGIFVLFVTIRTDDKSILKLLLFIMASKNIRFKDIVKYDFLIRTIFFISIIMLNDFNIMNNVLIYRNDGSIRSSLGFEHPNKLGLNIMILLADYLYITKNSKNKEHKLLDVFVILISLISIYFVSNSRSALVCVLILLIYILFEKSIINHLYSKKIIKGIFKTAFIFFMILSVSLGLLFPKNIGIVNKINKMSSGRVYYTSYYLKKYDINLFGNKLVQKNKEYTSDNNILYFPFDNGYANLLLTYGLIISILLAYLFYKMLNELFKTKNYLLATIIFMFLIYGLMETGFININTNIYLLALANIFYDKTKLNNKKIGMKDEKVINYSSNI